MLDVSSLLAMKKAFLSTLKVPSKASIWCWITKETYTMPAPPTARKIWPSMRKIYRILALWQLPEIWRYALTGRLSMIKPSEALEIWQSLPTKSPITRPLLLKKTCPLPQPVKKKMRWTIPIVKSLPMEMWLSKPVIRTTWMVISLLVVPCLSKEKH